MKWNEFIVHTSNEAKEAVANILNEAGANGVAIQESTILELDKRPDFGEIYELDQADVPKDGVVIKAYFPENKLWTNLSEELVVKINKLTSFGINLGANKVSINTVAETDWENEWKKYFKPIKITDRFVIVPNWETYKGTDDQELIIHIDPGMAFGTGTHETTSLSIVALEKTVKSGEIVVDVGSGSGILSIAACLLGATHVFSYDLDEVAVSSTKQNRDLNGLSSKITSKQNHLLKNTKHEADIIVANILTHILVDLAEDAWTNLKQGGYFITSGIITEKESVILDKMISVGFEVIERFEKNKWVTFIAQKPCK